MTYKGQVRFHISLPTFPFPPIHFSLSFLAKTHSNVISMGGGDQADDTNLIKKNHHHHHHHHKKRVLSTSTTLSSSSSSSFHSPFSPSSTLFLPFPTNINNSKTMEEVWKDITLSSSGNPTAAAAAASYPGFTVQDFLARPFSNNDKPTRVSSPVYGSPSPPTVVQQPPRPTLLNLNTGPDQLNFLGEEAPQNVCPIDVPFDHVLASANSSSSLLAGGMRMLPAADRNGGDRRHKRMIKNRESAARSRARKQAYTNELENEVERLKEENNRLKKQQQQMKIAAAAQVTKRGSGLHRTSTAPF